MKKLLLLLSMLVGISACDSNARLPVSTSEAELLSNITTKVIVPAVGKFSMAAQTLEIEATAFCLAPQLHSLISLQGQWKASSQAWYALAVHNFGPLDVFGVTGRPYTFIDSLRLRGTDYSVAVKSNIQASIAASNTLDYAYFSTLVFSEVGLLPLEYLLFEEYLNAGGKNSAAIVAEFGNTRKCAWLQGLSKQLATVAKSIDTQWNTSFQGGVAFKNTLLDTVTTNTSLLMVVNTAQAYFDYLKLRNVIIKGGKFSGSAWLNATASVDAVELLLQGGGSTPSIFTQMQAAGSVNGLAQVKDSIASARAAIAGKNSDTLNIAFGLIDGNFKREIPDALALVQGINFSDGD